MREIIVIGGGIIGLAIAVNLRQRGAKVTVITREFKEAASLAAAGMLAPQAEQIPPSAMLDLCLASRDLYSQWTAELESLTGARTGYWQCGIVAPRYECSIDAGGTPWQSSAEIEAVQSGLSDRLAGGFWYPDDATVDNQALTHTLWLAAQELGIEVKDNTTVEAIVGNDGSISHIATTAGPIVGQHYILAAGAWTQALFPIPISPRKGQMLSLRAIGDNQPLQRVLFGEDIYIVPRRDGRIVIGATSEDVGFAPGNTAGGIHRLLDRAIALYPYLATCSFDRHWWGYRPVATDELPVLGNSTRYDNLTLATGHYRNGILLTPITAKTIGDLVWEGKVHPTIEAFLPKEW
jgi:glycine oxidase ThiO